jgi:1-phosphatidylinositol-3-phosphate 5-kinase
LLQKFLHKEAKAGGLMVDVLELCKLHRHILILSYVWDQRLIYASNQSKITLSGESRPSYQKQKSIGSKEKVVETDVVTRPPARGRSSSDFFHLETKPDGNLDLETTSHLSQSCEVVKGEDKFDSSLSPGANINDKPNCSEFGGAIRTRRTSSEGGSRNVANLSDTLDAAWTGETHSTNILYKENGCRDPDVEAVTAHSPTAILIAKSNPDNNTADIGGIEAGDTHDSKLHSKGLDTRWTGMLFANSWSVNKSSAFNAQKLVDYNFVHILSFRELDRQTGARLLLPAGINDTIVPVYDDEPTSVIAHALVSKEYYIQMTESDRPKDSLESSVSLPLFDSTSLLSLNSLDETITNSYRSFGSSEESMTLSTSGSRMVGDSLLYSKDFHARVSFNDDSSLGKVKYTVTCYYAKRFEALRRTCCPTELDFVRSLSRCKKWGAQGGKSNVFFAKTLDDRFVVKQVTKTELESFFKFAPAYFKYLSESISTGSPTCLAKILGIYQVLFVKLTYVLMAYRIFIDH